MGRFNKHIIVVGSARSGTSWLSETLAQPYRYRMLFEPEEETRTKHGYLLCDKWISSKNDSAEAYAYLRRVFKNRVDCDWIAQNSNRKWKRHLWPFVPKQFIIKFVRCNLSAQYMNTIFNIPVIHIIRNPYDVIQSQQRANFPWLIDFTHFLAQPDLVAIIKETYSFNLDDYKKLTHIQVLCLRWCLENDVVLNTLGSYTKNAKVLKYEDLIQDISVFHDLCRQYNLESAPDIGKFYRKPSSKTHKQSAIRQGKVRISKWTVDELREINTILNIFGSNLYPRKHL